MASEVESQWFLDEVDKMLVTIYCHCRILGVTWDVTVVKNFKPAVLQVDDALLVSSVSAIFSSMHVV